MKVIFNKKEKAERAYYKSVYGDWAHVAQIINGIYGKMGVKDMMHLIGMYQRYEIEDSKNNSYCLTPNFKIKTLKP